MSMEPRRIVRTIDVGGTTDWRDSYVDDRGSVWVWSENSGQSDNSTVPARRARMVGGWIVPE